VETDDTRVQARTVIIATGAAYRRLALENLSQFEGVGVYYAATPMEAQLCAGDEVVVVGGGNSAGQAATFLARTARRVYVMVRSTGLAESMSRYLIRRLEENPGIELRTQTEIVALEGDGHLERVHFRDNRTGSVETHDIKHVFLMMGAVPNTGWLDGCVALTRKDSLRLGPTCPQRIWLRRSGRSLVPRIFWKPVCPACLLLATSAQAISNGWRLRSAKDRLRLLRCIRCCRNESRTYFA